MCHPSVDLYQQPLTLALIQRTYFCAILSGDIGETIIHS